MVYSHRCTGVWIDHSEARIFTVDGEAFIKSIVTAPLYERLPSPQPEAKPRSRSTGQRSFFSDVAQRLRGSNQVLILGPSAERLHFRDYVIARASTLSFGVAGVEAADDQTDNQLVAQVRRHFEDASRRDALDSDTQTAARAAAGKPKGRWARAWLAWLNA